MNKCILEYIWIDDNKLLSTTHIININDNFPKIYNYKNIIKPCFICKNYLKKLDNCYLVLCDLYDLNNNPLSTNNRYNNNIFDLINYDKMQDDNEPYFILTQNYQFITPDANNQKIVDEHLQACLYADINISKSNIGVFNIGPCLGITVSDQLYISKYLLEKISEKYNTNIIYNNIIIYFSTKETKESNGINTIYNYINNLELQNPEYNFNFKIPSFTLKNKSGYFEISQLKETDPYLITSLIYRSCCL